MTSDLNFSGQKPPRCKHCGREKGSHRAVTFECPIGRGSFPVFDQNQKYKPRQPRKAR